MNQYPRLLRNVSIAIAIAAALVAVCYFFVDRPVAYFVHGHGLDRDHPVLKWLTYPPPIEQAWAPAILVLLMIRRAWGPFRRWQLVVLTASVSLIVADQFRDSMSFLFGRYWPQTWINRNPALIPGGEYGFHPFHSGEWYDSFPSGHTARTVGAAGVVWLAYPRWRWACIAVTLAVAVGLVGMNYHFVGDIVAGAFVGAIVAAYATALSGIASADSLTVTE